MLRHAQVFGSAMYVTESTARWLALGALGCAWLLACGDGGDGAEGGGAAQDTLDGGRVASSRPAYREPRDGGAQPVPPEFVPPDPPAPILAHGDAATPPAPSDGAVPAPSQDCLELEPGGELSFEAQLTAEHTWQRVDAEPSCPVTRVSAYEVAYAAYTLCASDQPRTLEITMLGADRLDAPPRQAVADTMLVVYPELGALTDDPFACLAIDDDGEFDGLISNSARIEALDVAAFDTPVIIATSHERPDQRGLGLFSLTLRAR